MPRSTELTWFKPHRTASILAILSLAVLATARPAAAQQSPSELADSHAAAALVTALPGGSPHWFIEQVSISNRAESKTGSKQTIFDAVRYTETPFVQGYSLPLRKFLRGHVELAGFGNIYSMENVMWGPPAAGSLPAWGVTAQSHVAVSAPEQEGSFGVTLTLHAAASDNDSGYFRPREWISWIVHNNRG